MKQAYAKSEIIKYRREKSLELIREVEFLLQGGFPNAAVSRMYYAAYHAISALLFSHDIETKTHKGLRQQFGNHYVKTGLIPVSLAAVFNEIYDKRQQSDYDDFMEFSLEKAWELFPEIKELIDKVISLIKE